MRVHPRKLTPDDVARTALRVLDELGLPDLTMRRLATELGVQPSALYWHFPDKQTLLAAVADRILPLDPAEGDEPAAGEDWAARLHAEADALRAALLAHRDSAEVVSSTIALGLGANPALARLRRALADGPFDELTADRAASTMLHLVLGQVSLEQQRVQYERLGVRAAQGEQPAAARPEGSDAEDFRFGVAALIAGLRTGE
ncbi:TetR family transcriptional regulator [Brachybacterium phenoliresistens]|uniref:TetR family transcriptional regulator n=1 Tax=Brachybacterium phenoliresistens TaxID=396014 RepID=Z9JU87_9MICO|nr:TetR family transcriptional regulator [Brachybacterium phenoliresistens]